MMLVATRANSQLVDYVTSLAFAKSHCQSMLELETDLEFPPIVHTLTKATSHMNAALAEVIENWPLPTVPVD